jgi:ribosome-binding factor A
VRNRKALQLCKQVAETLNLTLAGCADSLLNDLLVVDVRPAPDSTRLLVLVQSATQTKYSQPDVLQHLERARGLLRQEVARQIHRRKTPDLVFDVLEV